MCVWWFLLDEALGFYKRRSRLVLGQRFFDPLKYRCTNVTCACRSVRSCLMLQDPLFTVESCRGFVTHQLQKELNLLKSKKLFSFIIMHKDWFAHRVFQKPNIYTDRYFELGTGRTSVQLYAGFPKNGICGQTVKESNRISIPKL